MTDVSLEVSQKEQEAILKEIKTKCLECTIRFLGKDVPFHKLQFYFFRIALLFLPYSKALNLSEDLSIEDFQIESPDVNPVVSYISGIERAEEGYIDPILILSEALALDARHQVAIVYSLGLTGFKTQREFNSYFGVNSKFIKWYTSEVLKIAGEIDLVWEPGSDEDTLMLNNAKACIRSAQHLKEADLIKHPDGGLVSSETVYYQLCTTIATDLNQIDVSLFTERQLRVWRFIIRKYFETFRFPTYEDISAATGITTEGIGDNVRSIVDKITSESRYLKASDGLVKPIKNDQIIGQIQDAYRTHVDKCKNIILTKRERQLLNLVVNPIFGRLYRTLPQAAAEMGMSIETVRRILRTILDKINLDPDDQFLTPEGELLADTSLRVKLYKLNQDPNFQLIFSAEMRRFIKLMTERKNGVFRYTNTQVAALMGIDAENAEDDTSSSSVNRKLWSIFERIEEVEAVDTTGFKIRGNRLTLIKMRKYLNPKLFTRLTTSDLDVLMASTEQIAPKVYLSMGEIAERLNTNKDSARMRITFLLKKLNSLHES